MRDGLEQGAGAAEGEAHRDAREEARQAGAGEDLADRRAVGAVPFSGEVAHQVADADARRALGQVPQADEDGRGQEDRQDGRPGGAAAAFLEWTRRRSLGGWRCAYGAHFSSSTST